ncbi:MAG: glycosyltransferase family 2 protein [Candidatus Bathyarchaeota archaeon]|nr:glycosyltransferase family 2 protein [Candidatus Bathyarchaeota archaeon]
MPPHVTIVILNYNRKAVLSDCLDFLLKVEYPNYDVVVVDNASTDRKTNELQHKFPSVRFIVNPENFGYAQGNNIGINHALLNGAKYILILNDDTAVRPNFLTELVNVAESNPHAGMLIPKVLCFEEPDKLYQAHGSFNYYLYMVHGRLDTVDEPVEVDRVFGTAILVKRAVVDEVGLLDSQFFLYFEDFDWCYRATKAGYKLVYVPSATIYHKVSKSFSGKPNPLVMYYSTRNELLFAKKHLNPLLFWPLWVPRFTYRVLRCLLTTGKPQPAAYMMRGFFDFTKSKFGKLGA